MGRAEVVNCKVDATYHFVDTRVTKKITPQVSLRFAGMTNVTPSGWQQLSFNGPNQAKVISGRRRPNPVASSKAWASCKTPRSSR